MNKKRKSLIGAIILLFGMSLGIVAAYTPTSNLCFDEDRRGIECSNLGFDFSFWYALDEIAFWDRSLSDSMVDYLYNEGKGRKTGLCFNENQRGYACIDGYSLGAYNKLLNSSERSNGE